jgi:hypothetical protein
MEKSVFCIATVPQANAIVQDLQAAGFSVNDISVLMADKDGTRDFVHEHHTKAPEGATAGAGAGVAVGGVIGLLAGIGTLAIPGLGPLIAAGPIMAALSGAAVGGTLGGISGALIGLGMPEFEATQYEGKVKTGSALLSVHSDTSEELKRARKIFESVGAQDISTAGEAAAARKRPR